MHNQKNGAIPEKRKHEPLLLFLCFLTSSIAGYILTHYLGLLGAWRYSKRFHSIHISTKK